jgi:Na+/alanine symporter
MVHWPKSVAGYVLALMLAVIVVGGVVQLAILLSSHLLVLAFLVVALTTGALIVRHRRAAAAHDLAVADAPSFGDVLRNWDRHDDDLDSYAVGGSA